MLAKVITFTDHSTDSAGVIRTSNGNENMFLVCSHKQKLNKTYTENTALLNMHNTEHANEQATSTHKVHHYALLTCCMRATEDTGDTVDATHTHT